MKYLYKAILATIVCVECAVLVFIGYGLYLKKNIGKNILGAVTVVPVRKEYLISSPSAELQYFYEPLPNVQQEDQEEWLPYKATYTINADSLNERFDYSVEKSANVFRIITLGDSFTFGHYVNTIDNWTEQLEVILNMQCKTRGMQKIEVINLGERGYDVQYIAHKYDLRGVKYHPDLIIWLESGSGFERLSELYAPLLQKYDQSLSLEEKTEAEQKQDYYLAWTKTQEEISKRYSEDQKFEQVHAAWLEFFNARGDTKTIITTFSNISSQNKAKLKLWTVGQPNTFLNFGIRDIYSKNGVLADGHPNKEGHLMIAEDMYNYLTEHQIITCQ